MQMSSSFSGTSSFLSSQLLSSSMSTSSCKPQCQHFQLAIFLISLQLDLDVNFFVSLLCFPSLLANFLFQLSIFVKMGLSLRDKEAVCTGTESQKYSDQSPRDLERSGVIGH